MTNLTHVQLFLLLALAVAVHSQTYPRFEFKDTTLGNNSFVFLEDIGEGNNSLRCVTNRYIFCCSGNRARGDWYNEQGRNVQGPNGNRSLYVTRTDNGVVNLNRRHGGQSGMWRCNIPGSSGDFENIYIYIGTLETGTNHCIPCMDVCILNCGLIS